MIISIIFLILIIVGIGGCIIFACFENSKVAGSISLIITLLLTIGLIAGGFWYFNNTESGKRSIKDIQSNVNKGIERVVTVYDVNGKEIKKYEGRFDVSYDSDRIKFDDEQGKRHIVYYTTGTITIDEK